MRQFCCSSGDVMATENTAQVQRVQGIVEVVSSIDELTGNIAMKPGAAMFEFYITEHIVCNVVYRHSDDGSYSASISFRHVMSEYKRAEFLSGFCCYTLWEQKQPNSLQRGIIASLGLTLSIVFPAYVKTIPKPLPLEALGDLEITQFMGIMDFTEWRSQMERARKIIPALGETKLYEVSLAQHIRSIYSDDYPPCRRCLKDMHALGYESVWQYMR